MHKTGVKFSTYTLGRLLGKGTFAMVYQLPANKVIKCSLSTSSQFLFKDELDFMLKAGQQLAPKLYDHGVYKGYSFLVMEDCGPSLNQLYQSFTVQRKVEVIIKIFFLIRELFKIGISHSDIKLENIGSKGPRFLDFGSASNINPLKSTAEIKIGSLPYNPPEYYSKGKRNLSNMDSWASGVMAYEIFEGKHPFIWHNKTNEIELGSNIVKGKKQSFKHTPKKFRSIIDKLLEINISKRIVTSEAIILLSSTKTTTQYQGVNLSNSGTFFNDIINTVLSILNFLISPEGLVTISIIIFALFIFDTFQNIQNNSVAYSKPQKLNLFSKKKLTALKPISRTNSVKTDHIKKAVSYIPLSIKKKYATKISKFETYKYKQIKNKKPTKKTTTIRRDKKPVTYPQYNPKYTIVDYRNPVVNNAEKRKQESTKTPVKIELTMYVKRNKNWKKIGQDPKFFIFEKSNRIKFIGYGKFIKNWKKSREYRFTYSINPGKHKLQIEIFIKHYGFGNNWKVEKFTKQLFANKNGNNKITIILP